MKPVQNSFKTTWPIAIRSLMIPILILMILRWGLIEPYVIPSGSMLPTLKIHDHIIVNKWKYGIRLPWTSHWVWRWQAPQRGEILVFRKPDETQIFYVKRIIGLPGEHIRWEGTKIWINGQRLDESSWLIKEIQESDIGPAGEITLSQDQLFCLGDNRINSLDSRYIGPVSTDLMVGSVAMVWLACDQFLESGARFCNPATINWSRIGFRPQ